MSSPESTSSPIATGGGGTFFEQRVGAFFLAQLLVRGIPPLLKDCQVDEVHFQIEHRGWSTDDVLVIGEAGEDRRRKLAAQVKRSFTVGNNSTCRETFADFWADFRNPDIFDPDSDRLALITLRGTNTLLEKFASVLDSARASIDEADFQERLSPDGPLSKKARKQARGVRAIVDEAAEESVSDEQFWKFLCVLNVISLDLGTQTAQHESSTKTLLAQTATEPDPVGAAESTWTELLQRVGSAEGMPAAGSYSYGDLPQDLRTRHEAPLPRPEGPLRQLINHSTVTLKGIQTKINNNAEITREDLETRILRSLENTQVTVISGAAGQGKSAVAKKVVEQIRDDYFCLAFRAEEFAKNHLNQALQEIQESLTVKRLLGLIAGQGRTVVFVDGIDRLLESSERKAFTDLLQQARDNQRLRLILTCRDYSVDKVRMSLLERVAIPHDVLKTPPFSDKELQQVAQQVPELSRAIGNSDLREFLRTPYFLDIAARVDWSEDKPLPGSEREFRQRCWREVIRNELSASGGMPTKRERVFIDLALRRAKELRPFVQCDDFDPEALEALSKDDLITFPEKNSSQAAPAHDVLEDWAIIRWINSRYARHEGDEGALADDIEGYPALRRGYRKWLGEMLEIESEETDSFVLSAFKNEDLPSYFRDDTIISTLLSSSAADFLLRNRDELLAREGRLLARVIHLLRVACKTAPPWLDGAKGLTSQLLIPTGTAWAPVLEIVNSEIEVLLPQHFGVLMGLVENWAKQVTYWNLKPAGYTDAGEIVIRLLDDLDDYSSEDLRQRALKILVQIPAAVPEAFRDLLRRGASGDNRDIVAEDLVESLLTEGNSSFACRFYPEEIAGLARSYFFLTDEDVEDALEHPHHAHSSFNIDPNFGIKPHVNHKFSVPASAIKGPFFPLLQWHPEVGVEFIIELMNHVSFWYGNQKWPFDSLEPAWQTELHILGEDTTVTQWANSRLYGIYRGASVAPYVLQSALMALEKWLVEIAETEEFDLEAWLLKLLKESNNVAVTAVVASVSIAHPEKCGRAGLPLLTSRTVVQLDRGRMSHDRTSPSMSEVIPSMRAKQKIYDDERKNSDDLPHRQRDLEYLSVKLQFNDLHEEVWRIIDQHREELPLPEEQSEKDKTWRLALHRMDARGFEIGEEVPASEVEEESESSDDTEKTYFKMALGEIEPDLEEIVEQNEQDFEEKTEDLSLMNWGRSAWEGNLKDDSRSWREMLSLAEERDSEAAETNQEADTFSQFTTGGPGFVASVCVRDHWAEMDSRDRTWCVEKLIDEIERFEDSDDIATVEGRGSTFPDRYAAYALSRVIQERGVEGTDDRVISTIATALTHSVTEVREYAAEGLGYHLREDEKEFATRCAGALARQSRLIEELRERQKGKSPQEQLRGRELIGETDSEVQQDIIFGDVNPSKELENLDTHSWAGRVVVKLVLRILGHRKGSDLAVQLHKRVASSIVKDWKRERENRSHGRQRDFKFEGWCARSLARFALRLEEEEAASIYQPILQSVEDYPGNVADFVDHLIYKEDGLERETPFWKIWQSFADRFHEADWIDELDEEYSMGREGRKLLRRLLLGIQWKDDVRYWLRLRGQEDRVESFVQQLPPSSASLKWYCRFLYYLGEKVLPRSFTFVAERLEAGDPPELLSESNTVYYLESLLRRYVYGEPLQLKTSPDIREAALYILNQLVEAGSSAAYQMRDDFVTPASADISTPA